MKVTLKFFSQGVTAWDCANCTDSEREGCGYYWGCPYE